MAKQKLFLIIAAILFAATLTHAQPADSLSERYVKKVLIEAKWGDGPGELRAIERYETPYGHGPIGVSSFNIDAKGNIYIPDLHTIKKYDKSGKYCGEIPILVEETFGVDENGNIYIPKVITGAKTKDSIGMRLLIHYNDKGELIRAHKIMADLEIPWYTASINKGIKVINGEIVFETEEKEMPIGRVDRFYSKNEQRARSKVPGYKYNILRKGENKYILEIVTPSKQNNHHIIPQLDKITKHIYLESARITDKYGNCYVYVDIGGIGERHDYEIWKFSSTGVLIARIPRGYREWDKKALVYAHSHIIDMDGNVYLLRNSKEGVAVIKYEK